MAPHRQVLAPRRGSTRLLGWALLALGLTSLRPAWGAPPQAAPGDRLGEALALVGFDRADLGFRPKGYWSRYPNPAQMAHKLPFFDDLLAEPLRVYDFTRIMAMAAADHLSPRGLQDKEEALYQLVYFLGVDRKVTGFRSYSANLSPDPDPETPLVSAVERVYAATGGEMVRMAFGERHADLQKEIRGRAASVDPEVQKVLANLVLNALDAYRWRQQAFRNVRPEHMASVFRTRDLAHIMDEGRVYHFEFDDLARAIDEQSLYYACMKTVQAADDARRQFAALRASRLRQLRGAHFDFATPIGRIVLAGTDDDVHDYGDAAILVDLGGDDRYRGPVGATASTAVPISIAIDCAGNDLYEYRGDTPAQGAGVLGAGVLVDDGGDDIYRARHYAQGLGLFGLGLLFDREGTDQYTLDYSGQGAGYFGLGYLFDAAGDDECYLYGDGQGFGGAGGVGVLADYAGDDHYVAEALAAKAGRPDYHSQGRIAYSNAQGVGAGRRGDGSDGHNWAGGLGVLLDIQGSDRYEAGNFSLGTGYMYGTGLLYDGDGSDSYRSVYFTQGSGAHFCIGALIDEGGDDTHVLYDTGGAGLAFGWDFAVALLVDKRGNDRYEARGNSLGRADIRSNALFFDLGGNDEYVFPQQAGGMGFAPPHPGYRQPGYAYGPYNYYANACGLLLDLGGEDRYLDLDPDSGQRKHSPVYRDNHTWQQPAPGSPDYGYRAFGVGMDAADGTVPELGIFDGPEAAPPGAGGP
ncbi:MAG: hypothetical protein AB1505_26605 [Candidatus Latescibacterota bacterium]